MANGLNLWFLTQGQDITTVSMLFPEGRAPGETEAIYSTAKPTTRTIVVEAGLRCTALRVIYPISSAPPQCRYHPTRGMSLSKITQANTNSWSKALRALSTKHFLWISLASDYGWHEATPSAPHSLLPALYLSAETSELPLPSNLQ